MTPVTERTPNCALDVSFFSFFVFHIPLLALLSGKMQRLQIASSCAIVHRVSLSKRASLPHSAERGNWSVNPSGEVRSESTQRVRIRKSAVITFSSSCYMISCVTTRTLSCSPLPLTARTLRIRVWWHHNLKCAITPINVYSTGRITRGCTNLYTSRAVATTVRDTSTSYRYVLPSTGI
jgi:hypothetical protein